MGHVFHKLKSRAFISCPNKIPCTLSITVTQKKETLSNTVLLLLPSFLSTRTFYYVEYFYSG